MDIKIFAKSIDQKTKEQLENLSSLPVFKASKIRIMPDVHAGFSCVIGFTADLKNLVIPNVVGVDIGCGMLMTKIEASWIDFNKLDQVIRSFVPNGKGIHQSAMDSFDYSQLRLPFSKEKKNLFDCSLGSLGGGNHFIEIDRREDGSFYLLIHSGSRAFGAQIADFYQKRAITEHSLNHQWEAQKQIAIQKRKEEGETEKIAEDLKRLALLYKGKADIPMALCYLEGEGREDYLNDMRIAQAFAKRNRALIRDLIFDHMGWKNGETIECVHNYIGEDNIIRKGAASARQGESLIIPLNMKDGVILARGKGNEDWNCSAPHGAGRKMARAKAKTELKVEDFVKEMEGIYSTTVNRNTLDEAPDAYKDPDDIITYLPETATIEAILKPVYNFKAG